jgi:hypothetical protein
MGTAKAGYALSQDDVFATAPFAERRVLLGEPGPAAGVEAHAKVMGTTTTLCGLRTDSWHKFWDLAFAKVRGDRCRRCSKELANLLCGQVRR